MRFASRTIYKLYSQCIIYFIAFISINREEEISIIIWIKFQHISCHFMIMKRDMLSNHCSSSCTLCTLKWSDNLRIFQTTQIHGASNFLTAHLRFDCIHLLRKFHGISHVAIKTIRFRRRFWCGTFLWHWNCNSLWLNTLLDGFFRLKFHKTSHCCEFTFPKTHTH